MTKYSVTNHAWEYLSELPPHTFREHNVSVYDSMLHTVYSTNIPRTAKGLATTLEMFFMCAHRPPPPTQSMSEWEYKRTLRNWGYPTNWPEDPKTSQYHELVEIKYYDNGKWLEGDPDPYSYVRKWMLKPETFIDNRPDDLKDMAELFSLKPGEPMLDFKNWVLWGRVPDDKDAPRSRNLQITIPYINYAMYRVGVYWHIPTISGNRPSGLTQMAGAVLEAIGNQYLTHPLLPPKYR